MENVPENFNQQADNPFTLSKQFLLVVTFNKSTSKNFQTALLWAKSAKLFKAMPIGKDEIYLCGFDKTAEQAGAASVFLTYIENWTGKQIYIGGIVHSGSVYDLFGILDCYQKSLACPNSMSYCCVLEENVFLSHETRKTSFSISLTFDKVEEEPKQKLIQYVIPCQKLQYLKLEKAEYLGSWQEQIEALAVRQNIAWCPSFDASRFRQYD